ncbi:hypothetical protein, partial [Staphylococcus aureus]|uniref:hypothetical protein n=1 Tax=Staphylococcus aureus TaxID=1280 RepID=UPI003D188B7B
DEVNGRVRGEEEREKKGDKEKMMGGKRRKKGRKNLGLRRKIIKESMSGVKKVEDGKKINNVKEQKGM